MRERMTNENVVSNTYWVAFLTLSATAAGGPLLHALLPLLSFENKLHWGQCSAFSQFALREAWRKFIHKREASFHGRLFLSDHSNNAQSVQVNCSPPAPQQKQEFLCAATVYYGLFGASCWTSRMIERSCTHFFLGWWMWDLFLSWCVPCAGGIWQ